jgi:hypothetical protein
MTALGYMLGFGGSTVPTFALDFESSSSQYLSMTDGNWGSYNGAKFAISVWLKRESTGSQIILHKGSDGANANSEFLLQFSSDAILFRTLAASAIEGALTTTATYTSTTTWYHIYVTYDSANATAGDRMRMWVNGTEVTSFSTDTNPSNAAVNKNVPINWGARGDGAVFFDGLMYQMAFFSGSLPAASLLYNNGVPLTYRGIKNVAGLKSLLVGANASIIKDSTLGKDWTNNNGVITSVSKP